MSSYRASDGALLSYTEAGARGELPLLLLHGWQADGSVWSLLPERLHERFRTVAIDFRGSGASAGAPGPYTVERFARDVGDLIETLDLDPALVVGHSMGGAVAQRLAIDRPEAVEGLVLVAPVAAGGFAFRPSLAAALRDTAGDPLKTSAWLAQLTVREPPPEARDVLRRAAAGVPAAVALETFDSWTGLHFAGEAATIETPALVIAPEADRPMTPEFLQEHVVALLRNSRLERFADCGHYVQIDEPERLARAIEAFASTL